jgi:REP element-mobilizing transposase RayT
MPRKSRIDAPGAVHHIIIRGIDRKEIFKDDFDRNDFLDRLGKILQETATTCYAWALIPNHAHLLLKSGKVPVAGVMGRLLTGYAQYFNRRYQRHGHVFQNRYKSILCQEDIYLLELVRYIHLNPLRAKTAVDYNALRFYPYCGHSVIMGKGTRIWQDSDYILGNFGKQRKTAQNAYQEYVREGIEKGKRPELVGGGLIRSLGGWKAIENLQKGSKRQKGDERILGEGEFVLGVLKEAEEEADRRYKLRAKGYDLEKLAKKAAKEFGIKPQELIGSGKRPAEAKARSLFCYLAVKGLGISATEAARYLKITQPAVSLSARRGEQLAKEKNLKLFE